MALEHLIKIGKTYYTNFSCEKVSFGGMSQAYAMQLLKENGIKVRRGYTPYSNCYGLYVEAIFAEKASKLLFH
jgi:hypothetical protein